MAQRPDGAEERPDLNESVHQFGVGTIVRLISGHDQRSAAPGSYKIVAQLPGVDQEVSYRIKSVSEPHERVVRQSQLTR